MNSSFEGNSHTGTNVWLTPPTLLKGLGAFDLDPCACTDRPWDTAINHYTIEDNGLIQPWFGRVFCNPPYETALNRAFIERCIKHKDAIALTFARTETKLFQELIFKHAHSVFFIAGRLSFCKADGTVGGTAGAPSCLIAFSEKNTEELRESGIKGKLLII